MHLCVEFVCFIFLPMIECALSFKISCTYHARYALIGTSFTKIFFEQTNVRCSKGWCVHNYFCIHNTTGLVQSRSGYIPIGLYVPIETYRHTSMSRSGYFDIYLPLFLIQVICA